jgi:Asp-tRNA(Asn)/Glu-tRNA(Gln) amidotransferase A subunit family amidase
VKVKGERLECNRRRFFECLSALGLGATLMPDALTLAAQDAETVTAAMLDVAEKMAGVSFTREERESILERLNAPRGYLAGWAAVRAANLGNDTQPAIVFNPVPPGKPVPSGESFLRRRAPVVSMPATDEALAFLPLTHLARLIESRQIKPSQLTELYLARLKKHDANLRCVVTLTEETARRQARQADEEIAAGTYRGPLHGIPWGFKDLFSVRGTKTTWGASLYRDRVIDVDATVFEKLTQAGAILVAKLATGTFALGAQWFGGVTRNPWNPAQDASGSSAGPGSATAAGLVGFSIGTDTGGSIIQPATRNGVTGLRPTFGRVSRHGAMALAWTQDTVGPICRSAEDCAIVLDAIRGLDGRDNTVLDIPFRWDADADVSKLRAGYLRTAFENGGDSPAAAAARRNADEALRIIRDLGVQVVPFDLPDVAIEAIDFIRYVESAAAFDDLIRTGAIRELERGPEESRRPAELRPARFVPAVEYVQANRYRMRVMQQMDAAMAGLDLFIGANQGLTNRTGHPVISIPSGFVDGTPTGLQFTGKLFGEAEILLLAHAFQSKTDHHLKHPPLPA